MFSLHYGCAIACLLYVTDKREREKEQEMQRDGESWKQQDKVLDGKYGKPLPTSPTCPVVSINALSELNETMRAFLLRSL